MSNMFDDSAPIYRQIADRIKDDVASGVLAADAQVMSTNQYASFYGINPATAAKAFAQLVEDGVIYKRRGLGMFVAPTARDRLLTERREHYYAKILDPALDEAKAIGIALQDILAHIAARSEKEKS